MKQFILVIIIACGSIAADLLFLRCKGEPDVNPKDTTDKKPSEPVPTGKVLMHLHNFIEATEVDAYNIPYTTEDGRKISLSIGLISQTWS